MLQYAIRMFAKSERSQSDPRSIPAMLVIQPNAITTRQSILITAMKLLLSEIRFAQISVNDINPSSVENAKSPKHTDTRRETAALNAVPGVSSATEATNLGSFPSSNHASALSVSQTCPMITTKAVSVQITIVSRKTPID